MKSLTDIRIQMDFEVTEQLVELYRRSTHDPFIGYENPLSLTEAAEKMHQYSTTKRYGQFERLAIMKIWKDDVLVGFSLPRKIAEREYRGFKIEGTLLDWYRIGTIYVDEQYRGQGITSEVVRLFKIQYPNLIWQCEQENINSCKAAEKAGFKLSHHVYFKNKNQWSFEPDEDFPYGYHIFKFV